MENRQLITIQFVKRIQNHFQDDTVRDAMILSVI